MPLRDHFRSPLDDVHSWDELHGMWPAMIVRELVKVLPEPYFAAPGVHLGTLYEVRVYDSRRNRHLVAAIEIVGPSHKDGPENRATFVSKMATLLRNNVCVSIIDVVSICDFNLYADLVGLFHGIDPALGGEPPPMYAATLRTRHDDRRRLMENWYHSLTIGRTLPTLPVWLKETLAIPLDLESSYEESCRALRIW
jgi:hypothetical protein